MTNPLLEEHALPPFSQIEPHHVEPAIHGLIEANKARITELLEATDAYTWDNLLEPLEEMEDRLAQAWSPVSHLNSVNNSDAMREAYNACLPLLSEYGTWTGQHAQLCAAYQHIAEGAEWNTLDTAQRKTIDNALRDFRLAGVSLPQEKKNRYGELQKRLSALGSQFSENVLDATRAWSKRVSLEQLEGLPDTALANARQAAEQAGHDGYLITLDFPSYMPVQTYCHDRALREEVYTAFCTRASDLGPQAGKWDNGPLIDEILRLRHELAQLLGYDNYAELSLERKMAPDTDHVMDFLMQLASQSRDQGIREWESLVAFSREQNGPGELMAWDVAYYSEQMRQARYSISQEDVRPYLPVGRVLEGLFEVVARLFGVDVRECREFDRYHESLRLFELVEDNNVIARFYLDLYARADKRGGAWMDDYRVRRASKEGLQIPVAYLVCNFTPPVGDTPALLTHTELTTLFHEFGHGLHHMLSQQMVAPVSGINGVAWDAVELPSQFMENWCWEREALAFISGHFATGEPLPDALLDKLLAARNFQAAMALLRQLEFSLFDFRLHLEWGRDTFTTPQALLDEVRSALAVTPTPDFNRFQNGFSHIFAGGYAAGYYSYKWAEVLSADAFSRFEEEGIFNHQTGADFRAAILAQGGSEDPMTLFTRFRGREPEIESLLRHSGIHRAA